jgi:probable F420-dependent oxidoreductase
MPPAGMKYAVIVPNWAPFDQEVMLRLAQEVEALGFDHLFYTDHLMNPYAESEGFAEETVEAWSLISFVAARTTTIRIGTAVTPMSLRPPALLAKQVATIDNLSGGRIDVGVGTGWSGGSYGVINAGFGVPKTRKSRMRESLELIVRLWTEDVVNYEGDHYAAQDAVVAPKPLQKPHPPLWIGGWRPHMQTLTAQLGQGWIPWNRPLDFYADALQSVRTQATELGRVDDIVLGHATLILPDRLRDERLSMIHGDPPNLTISTVGEAIDAYAGVGAQLFAFLPFPASDALDLVRQFARDHIT